VHHVMLHSCIGTIVPHVSRWEESARPLKKEAKFGAAWPREKPPMMAPKMTFITCIGDVHERVCHRLDHRVYPRDAAAAAR
jgi:hypothetical protein